MGSYSLSQKEHLKKNEDFQKVFKNGRSFQTNFLKAFFLKNDLGFHRIGTGCDRGLWNKKTTLRNRFKRIIKEAYRRNKPILKQNFDIILIGKNLNKTISSAHIETDLKKIFSALE